MHIELDISANTDCNDIVLTVYVDHHKIFQSTAQSQIQTITYDLDEDPEEHKLLLVMSGKNSTHTRLDDNDQIVSDIFFTINRLEFEQLDMKELFCQGRRSWHTHSFNSSQPEFDDEFYGDIGCNGTVVIPFSTPIYLWLSDNLD
jgi:hypothetical protein